MTTKELRDQSEKELIAARRGLKEELLNLRIQQETGQLENSSLIKKGRREVARIETILTERQLAAQAAQAAPKEAAAAAE